MLVLDLQNVPEMSFMRNTVGSNVWAAMFFRIIPTWFMMLDRNGLC